MTQSTSRRERARLSTLAEIHAAARKLLNEQGSAAVTINAVAREVGMSGPALYHYYRGHEDLVGAVTADFYAELAETMRAATGSGHRLLTMCRAMRNWAMRNRAEFGWMFATPVSNRAPESPRQAAGESFEQVFAAEVASLWTDAGFPTPDLADLSPTHRAQLEAYSASTGGALPPAAMHVFLSCWIRLYGLLCMEVLNQLDFAYTDLEPVFEECLAELSTKLGITYEPPA